MSQTFPTIALTPLSKPPQVEIVVPGSKSQTNRALLCSFLAEGTTTLEGFLFADDTVAMLRTIEQLGSLVETDESANRVTVAGVPRQEIVSGPLTVNFRQSGTTGRFILPLLTLGNGSYVADGHEQLRSRPMEPLVKALRSLGANIENESLPITVHAGDMGRSSCSISGSTSSQFLSGLMLTGPALKQGIEISVKGDLISTPYVDLTAETMRLFGVQAEVADDYSQVRIPPQQYQAANVLLEPDASAASYFFAAAAITGGKIKIRGLHRGTVQGDLAFVDLLAQMGADVTYGSDWVEVQGTGTIRGIQTSMESISDTAQTLAIVATFADSPTEVTGIGFIRHKETDRIGAVVTELRKRGIDASETDDGFRITPGVPTPGCVETYDDHRMAMSFALLGLVHPGIEIANPICTSKTFPKFFDVLKTL